MATGRIAKRYSAVRPTGLTAPSRTAITALTAAIPAAPMRGPVVLRVRTFASNHLPGGESTRPLSAAPAVAPVDLQRERAQREAPCRNHQPPSGAPRRAADRDRARLHEPVRRHRLRQAMQEGVVRDREPRAAHEREHRAAAA